MFRTSLAAVLVLMAGSLHAQVAGQAPQKSTPTAPATTSAPAPTPATGKRTPPKPLATEAPGGGPDKVWVNLNSSTYHCYGDRYYGKTANGKYMTEADAKSAGAHGPRGKSCSTTPGAAAAPKK